MPKKARLLVIFALALLALFVLPGVSFASTHNTTQSPTTKASFAFTGLVTGTTTAVTGGLTLDIRKDGYFNGVLKQPDGTQISNSGKIAADGSLTITFYDAKGKPFIKGQGKPDAKGEYVGPFQVFQDGKQVATGKWSALPVSDPSSVLALAFTGTVTSGTDKGLFLSGAIVLNSKSLAGTLNLPDGTVIPLQATLSNGGKTIAVVFDLGNNTKIFGLGKLSDNPANPVDKGYVGPFIGPAADDIGQWAAYFFKF